MRHVFSSKPDASARSQYDVSSQLHAPCPYASRHIVTGSGAVLYSLLFEISPTGPSFSELTSSLC